ncbi:hypothetical protein SAMN04488490_1722 [Marinobacter sp. LV10R510-11A]|uniref:hypothetical protein n=1 Tax=Marinobacter sp. LV10R510-11A TaxID=1415568 RepID=UPI000BB97787|nr:hypothetical protein [Marinobacter sp. LV10R510-11A]SOB76051.1 hypothetical protein SAMN04488490_1722 [Marinobacter sp. LV10R510-11A]
MTVHQAPLNVNGWEGSGYAIIDPERGVGAYKISGGANGGEVSLPNGQALIGWLLSILDKASKTPFLKSLSGVFGKILDFLTAYNDFLDCGVKYAVAKFIASALVTLGAVMLILPLFAIFLTFAYATIISTVIGGFFGTLFSSQWSCKK